MAYDPMVYQQAASGAVDLGTKMASQGEVLQQMKQRTAAGEQSLKAGEQSLRANEQQYKANEFKLNQLMKAYADQEENKAEIQRLANDPEFQQQSPQDQAKRLSNMALRKGDLTTADKLLESSMKMEKMEWERKDQSYKEVQGMMDRAMGTISGASDASDVRSFISGMDKAPKQFKPLIDAADRDLKRVETGHMSFDEFKKKWSGMNSPLMSVKDRVQFQRDETQRQRDANRAAYEERRIESMNRKTDSLIAIAMGKGESKDERETARMAAAAQSRIASIAGSFKNDREYLKADEALTKAEQDLEAHAGDWFSGARDKARADVAAARKKMDSIVNRNMEQQRKIIMAQPDAVRNQLREANPDLFENLAERPAKTPDKAAPKKGEGTKESPLAMPTTKEGLVKDKVYNTPRGAAVWDGSQFTLVK